MSDEDLDAARARWAASLRDATARYRLLLIENEAPAGLIEELDVLDPWLGAIAPPPPLLSPHPPGPEDASVCRELLLALNELRARYVELGATHAAPGVGQESMAFLHVDEANHYAGLMAEIERLERAMAEAGCRV